MEAQEYLTQVMMMTIRETNMANARVQEACALCVVEKPCTAYKLAYLIPGKEGEIKEHKTPWIYVCSVCETEDKGLAPYWWNKALRGEALDEEE